MRVLILSSNNGGGHNAAASALREVFEARGDAVQVEDCLSFISEDVSEAVAKSHNFMYRHAPKLFDSGYRLTRQHPNTFKERHNGRRMLNLGRGHLSRFIQREGFDAVISTHVFGALMVTDARAKYGLPVRAAVVETDYTTTPGAPAGNMDWHFIPAPDLRAELEAQGVPGERIIVSGIPVRGAFYSRTEGARRALGMDEACRHLLVMGGSMGAGPLPELMRGLTREMGGDCAVSVVCGTNRALRRAMEADYGGDPRVRVYGYTDDVPLLMDSADALLTKPGGISVTEAAIKRLPMVLVDAVAGCEAFNLAYFTGIGGAATAEGPQALARLCLDVLASPARRADMARALDRVAAINDREIIWRTIHA